MTETDDTTTEDRRTTRKPTRDDGQPMKMKEMDHEPPVEGPNRSFERDNEGQNPQPDGGEPTDEDSDRQTMRDVDHESPVEGPNRSFERGSTDTDVGE